MKIVLSILAAGAAATGFAAAATAQTDDRRVRQIIVYGNDKCPETSANEIVVCARRPENDRYRIPENLREGERMRDGESWVARSEDVERMGREGIGSCSAVGPGGSTGCLAEMIRQYRQDRRNNAQPRRTD